MIWKPIEGFDGYLVSTNGLVKGKRGSILKPQVLKNGYLSVNLYNEKGMKTCTIHRLVASAFIPNELGLPQVNHINEDKSDNSMGNLEWCSAQFNIEHSQARSISLINPIGDVVDINNIIRFCRDNDLSAYGIRCVLSGKHKQHKGWTRNDNKEY